MEASFDLRCLFQKVMASLSNGKISCSFDGVNGYLQAVLLSRTVPSNRRRQWQPTPVLLPGKIPWMEEPGRL